ncbi:hypothetical protein ACHAXR_000445 [Thalassiosira sp. AJA248-18]
MRVTDTDTDSKSCASSSSVKVLERAAKLKLKKDKYAYACIKRHVPFVSFVYSMDGMACTEANTFEIKIGSFACWQARPPLQRDGSICLAADVTCSDPLKCFDALRPQSWKSNVANRGRWNSI